MRTTRFGGHHRVPTPQKGLATRDTYPALFKGPGTRNTKSPQQTHTCQNITFPQLHWRALTSEGTVKHEWTIDPWTNSLYGPILHETKLTARRFCT